MKNRVFPLTILSLLTAISFAAVQTPRSSRTALASTSQSPLQNTVREQLPESCPVTKPLTHPFVPPPPYPKEIGPDGFWFCSNKLWTQLPLNGTWQGLRPYDSSRTALRQKLFWWREGFDGDKDSVPMLKVTGKRLDSPAPALMSDQHANASWTDDPKRTFFIVTGIEIPMHGCWKITGRFEDGELSYVIWVTQ